jgi:hypothetical protein
MTPSTPKKLSPKAEPPKSAPISRMRAVKVGHNEYDVIVETWDSPPTKTEVVVSKVSGVSAQYRCRLHLEEQMGPNRLGGTGL